MDYLLARIDTRKKSNIRMVLSDVTTYHDVDLSHTHLYDDDYKLQEGEWFKVDEFRTKNFFKAWINEPFVAADYAQIAANEYKGLKFLVAYQDSDKLMFQRLFTGSVYENKTFLTFSLHDQPKLRSDDSQLIVINPVPDAIYSISENKLYFRSIPVVKPLFKGIEELYKEATREEVDDFLGLDLINVTGGFNADGVKTPNRRHIKEAQEIYAGYSDDDKAGLKSYAAKYCPDLNYNPTSVKCDISNDDQLKDLIYCILQRYYTTEIGGKKRVAHSVENMD